MKLLLEKIFILLAVSGCLASCADKDVYDEKAYEKNQKTLFSANFLKKYPSVNLNQDWDYSHKQIAYSLQITQSDSKQTRAAADYEFTEGEDYYEVDLNTVNWMKDKLAEQKDNRKLGKPFFMTVPNNEFTIVPIYQGQAGSEYSLHLLVDGVDLKVWEKSQGIQIKTGRSDKWQTLNNRSANLSNTLNAKAVRAKPYTFKNLPVGKEMFFYLEIEKGVNGYNQTGTQQSSLNGMMLALTDCQRPANIEDVKEVMIIACEDANLQNSDWDMNDVVFMIYGNPNVPKPIEINEGEPIIQKQTVRYMIEDLGATDDFDFNDIVVDVSDIKETTPIYTNGVLTSWNQNAHYQEATIRHLGGTLPFSLSIGDTHLAERAGEMGSTPDETFSVSNWDMNSHNVSIRVHQKGNTTISTTIPFPKAGEVPMIIAVDPTQDWMEERVSIPESWFVAPEE